MGATSTTGVSGPGMSHGRYKPELHSACHCCGNSTENQPTEKPKLGCVTNYQNLNSNITYQINSNSRTIQVC